VQAGIILFRTANSSFIFDLRRLSIRLWAVFRAIFLPAALVADGCFFLLPPAAPVAFEAAVAVEADEEEEAEEAAVDLLPAPVALAVVPVFSLTSSFSSCFFGFIWIIFLDLVGGGGSSKGTLASLFAADDLRLDLTVSLGCTGYSVLEDWPLDSLAGEADVMAGGGSSKAIWRLVMSFVPSLPLMSVEEAGVGGSVG